MKSRVRSSSCEIESCKLTPYESRGANTHRRLSRSITSTPRAQMMASLLRRNWTENTCETAMSVLVESIEP